MTLLRKLAGETAIYGISSILSRLLNYVILTPYFTRVFLTEEYGNISILYTYAAILMVLFTYRMETAFFRFGSKEGEMDRAFSTASFSLLGTTTFFCLLVGWFVQPIAGLLNYGDHPEYILLVGGLIALDALAAIPFARLRLENRPIRFMVAKTGQILLNIFFVYLFLETLPNLDPQSWLGQWYDPESRISWVFVANLLASGLILLLLLPVYLKIRLVFDPALLRRMLIYAMPLVVVGLAAVVNQLIALPLLENLLPGTLEENRAQTGIYSAAAKLAVLMNLFIQAFNYAAEPFFFSHAGRSDSREIYAQVGQAFSLIGSAVFLGIMLYMDVIKFFLGPDMREGIGVVSILLVAYFFLGLYYNFSIWYKLADRTMIGAYISVIGVAITLAINFWLVPNPAFGYYGAAYAALGCYGFMALASYWTGQRFYPIDYPLGRMMLYLAVVLSVYFLSVQLGHWTDLWALAAKMGLHTLLFLGAVGALIWFERRTLISWWKG